MLRPRNKFKSDIEFLTRFKGCQTTEHRLMELFLKWNKKPQSVEANRGLWFKNHNGINPIFLVNQPPLKNNKTKISYTFVI